MIQWVYDRASQASILAEVLVATDDERVLRTVEDFGGRALMTRSDHLSGLDRVAEVAEAIQGDVFVNIQGDEPLIAVDTIEKVYSPFEGNARVQVATARVEITDPEAIKNPNVVKVVTNEQGRALYFSRATIPYVLNHPASISIHLVI